MLRAYESAPGWAYVAVFWVAWAASFWALLRWHFRKRREFRQRWRALEAEKAAKLAALDARYAARRPSA